MKLHLKTIPVLLLFFSTNLFSQNSFYKVNGGQAISANSYQEIKNNLSMKGKIEELNLKTVKTKDSIINYVKLRNLITTPDGIDPWSETKKFIGTEFHIEKYVDKESKEYKNDYLKGKPTIINFWFTKCPPCIEELPILNKLKEKYGDKVNFISITFDDQKAIDEFLKKYEFKFVHIPNARKQIDELNIAGYPTSFILDKNGIIKIITPQITEFDIKDIETSIDILN